MDLHQEIRKVCADLFFNNHYPQAITEAFKKLNILVKNRSGRSDLDGKSLMLQVFSPKFPILKINNLKNTSDIDEQEGFMHIFAGVMQGIRNPNSHEIKIIKDPFVALEYICLASLLAKKVDSTKT